ncbi:MAG TPA: DUF3467 domain-containing protein [Planctomycetaceae bacterium]|nr:DUF3467 domain-containing protein [Planctomycetaceae bacterium]
MTDEAGPGPEEQSGEGPQQPSEPVTQEIQHSLVSALVPERVARGAFSTGAVVLNGAHEFIIDFLLRMSKPHQVSARVVLPPAVIPRFIAALQENLENYTRRFGPPKMPQLTPPQAAATGPSATQPASAPAGQPGAPSAPTSQQLHQTSAQELYEQLKIPDEELSGSYANAVMIGHTATEFSFDFITTFFPKSAVSKRVYMAAPNVPRLLDSLKHSFEQYQRKIAAARQNPPPTAPPPPQPDV